MYFNKPIQVIDFLTFSISTFSRLTSNFATKVAENETLRLKLKSKSIT